MLITIVTITWATPLTVWNCHGTRESKVPLGEYFALGKLECIKGEHLGPPSSLPAPFT